MKRQKCHCNGSSGTDCYWCGGSGWKTKSNPIIENQSTEKDINSKNNALPIKKYVVDYKIVVPINETRRLTYDERIKRLRTLVHGFKKNLPKKEIKELEEGIIKLYNDIMKLERKVTFKQRRHFNKIVLNITQVYDIFKKKFKKNELSN